MSFRRYAPAKQSPTSQLRLSAAERVPSGVKPASPPLISTGTATLDALLSPSSGLPISSALLVEEDGTGNYGGVILRQFVAEGVLQGNKLWIGGTGDSWWRGIPGHAKHEKSTEAPDAVKELEEKMKIAWRYGITENNIPKNDSMFPNFCHSFDISEQMPLPGNSQVIFSPLPAPHRNPYQPILSSLLSFLESSLPDIPVRLVLPDFMNPLIYPPQSTNPSSVLQFLHILLGIISTRPYCVLILSLSSSFYPRTKSLTSWIEHLCTHVIQLCPLPHSPNPMVKQPQGLVHVHKGGLMLKEMAYQVGKRGMVLEEWSLPPLEDEAPRVKQGFVIEKEVSKEAGSNLVHGLSSKDLEF